MYTSITNKNIWNIAYPIIMGNLAQTLISLTDTAFLGRVSEIALGASAMAGLYYYVFTTFAWGFSVGIQIIIARRLGQGRFNRIGVVFEHGLLFMSILGLTLFFLQRHFTDLILSYTIQSPDIYDAALEYMSYRHYGIMIACLNSLFQALYVGLSKTKIIGMTTIMTACVNVVFNYSLIFGKFGLPEMGIGGAALASVIAESSALLFYLIFTLRKLPFKRYSIFSFHALESKVFINVFRIATPTMIQKLLSFSTWYLFFICIESMGERPIAISVVIRSCYMLIILPVFGYGATANTLTSRLIGEGKQKEVLPTLFKINKLVLVSMVPMLLICYLFPQYILRIYTDNIDLIKDAIPSLYVVGLSSVAQGMGLIYFEAVSGTGNTIKALQLEICVLAIYIGQILLFTNYLHTQVHWVWTVEITYGCLIGIISLMYLKYSNWQKRMV